VQRARLPQRLQQRAERLRELAPVAERIVRVEVRPELPAEEDAHQRRRVRQALQAAVHEARVAQVAQPGLPLGPPLRLQQPPPQLDAHACELESIPPKVLLAAEHLAAPRSSNNDGLKDLKCSPEHTHPPNQPSWAQIQATHQELADAQGDARRGPDKRTMWVTSVL
jgi:hypothetical protein